MAPFRGKSSFRRNKRRFRRRRFTGNKSRMITGPYVNRVQSLQPQVHQMSFPNSRIVKMRFTGTAEFVAPYTYLTNLYAANSIFSPTIGSPAGTDRPLGYDQWNQFYTRYVVLRSVIDCKWAVQTTGAVPVIVAVQVADNGTAPANMMEFIQQGTTKYKMLQSAVNGNVIQRMSAFYSAKGWHEVVDVPDSDELVAPFTADPTDLTYFRVGIGSIPDLTNNTANALLLVTITYTVLLMDAKNLPSSQIV